jgi:polyisoprenoid-binding protein YceI
LNSPRLLRVCRPALLILFVAILAAPARAQRGIFELDPAQSAVRFTLKTSLHTVHGTFEFKSGTVTMGPDAKLSGLLVADATSGQSGDKGRDSKMHKEILESQKFPEITFAPQKFDGHFDPHGESHLQVTGTFRLHGQDHELVAPVAVEVSDSQVTFDSAVTIPYIAWRLKNPSVFIIRASDMVQVSIHAVGRWHEAAANE